MLCGSIVAWLFELSEYATLFDIYCIRYVQELFNITNV